MIQEIVEVLEKQIKTVGRLNNNFSALVKIKQGDSSYKRVGKETFIVI